MATPSIGLHTICYAPGMAAGIDPGTLPFDVSASPEPQRREIAHFLAFWRQGLHRKFEVSGLLSPRFGEKTQLGAGQFADFVRDNPGYDVWFINPSPHQVYLAYNLWEQGEIWHPGLCQRAERVLAAAGEPVNLRSFPRNNPGTLLYSNYWAGTPQFWDRYMSSVEALCKVCETMPEMLDPALHRTATTYYPFFFERYFTTFLTQRPEIKACAWKFSFAEALGRCPTDMEYLIMRQWGPMIEQWDARGVYDQDQRYIFLGMQTICKVFLSARRGEDTSYVRRA